ncbi:hypothetical protein AKO1_002082 [Acrasis kona]|uniref:DNA2/NAM7 helicase-like C-terminal domain-containing protein n=1 Tax=Acrasis kona TaxID=1008807 RepID=A0AAW2ZER7_9EUKA
MVKNEIKGVKVSTVDAFQGGEREIIILSCVRTSKSVFIENKKRLNVALTRARCHLIIVCHKDALMQSDVYRYVVDQVKYETNGIIDSQILYQNKNFYFLSKSLFSDNDPEEDARLEQAYDDDHNTLRLVKKKKKATPPKKKKKSARKNMFIDDEADENEEEEEEDVTSEQEEEVIQQDHDDIRFRPKKNANKKIIKKITNKEEGEDDFDFDNVFDGEEINVLSGVDVESDQDETISDHYLKRKRQIVDDDEIMDQQVVSVTKEPTTKKKKSMILSDDDMDEDMERAGDIIDFDFGSDRMDESSDQDLKSKKQLVVDDDPEEQVNVDDELKDVGPKEKKQVDDDLNNSFQSDGVLGEFGIEMPTNDLDALDF